MVHCDDPLALASDVISRFSLMSLLPDREVKIKQPFSDPTHISSRHRQALKKQLDKKSDSFLPSQDQRIESVQPFTPPLRIESIQRATVTNTTESVSSTIQPETAGSFVDRRVSKRKEPLRRLLHDSSEHNSRVNVRLSFPVDRAVEKQLPSSYSVDRCPAIPTSRPLTPILRVHCTRASYKHVPDPVQVNLKDLPADLQILLLQKYISPADLLNVRAVCRDFHRLCNYSLIKVRWKNYLTVEKLSRINRGQENVSRTPASVPRRMSRSSGPLSPIQPASSPLLRWDSSPKTPTTPQAPPRATSPLSPTLPCRARPRRPPPSPLAARPTRNVQAAPLTRQAAAQNTIPQTPHTRSSTSRALSSGPPPRHPSKRPPTSRDIRTDDQLPTPEKITPSKRSLDAMKKRGELGGRTPFRTLNTGTPNSTSSSKTSLSSTASLITTPDYRRVEHATPEFKVPSYSVNSKSRQRLKRL